MSLCDYCNEDKEKVYMLSNHMDCCSDCLASGEFDSDIKIIDPDAEYDRMRDREMMRQYESEQDEDKIKEALNGT